jgi:hypothetical protein
VSPSSRITITVEADGWFGLAERFVAALESLSPRRRFVRLSRGRERPRTSEGAPMASEVHRGNELVYDINAVDAITGASADLSGITWTATVEPAGAGELTEPDADGKFVFRPDEESDVGTCAIELRAEFADGSGTQILTDSVTIDPDGRVLSLGQGVEQARAG